MSSEHIASNSIFANPKKFVVLAGSTAIVNFTFIGTGTLSSATNKLYRNKEDVTATKLSSSNAVISGRIVTTALATFDVPGQYQWEVAVTDGSMARKKAVRFDVAKNGVE